jgi:hypothetical protein
MVFRNIELSCFMSHTLWKKKFKQGGPRIDSTPNIKLSCVWTTWMTFLKNVQVWSSIESIPCTMQVTIVVWKLSIYNFEYFYRMHVWISKLFQRLLKSVWTKKMFLTYTLFARDYLIWLICVCVFWNYALKLLLCNPAWQPLLLKYQWTHRVKYSCTMNFSILR